MSLLELVIVVSIISVLALVVVPQYASAISRQRIEAAARRIVLDLARAQRQAKTLSANQSVQFTIGSDSYTLPGVADMDDSSVTYTVDISQPPYEATLLSADFDGSTEMIYDGYGTPLNGVGGSIVVQVGSLFKTITVDGETGAVSVQ